MANVKSLLGSRGWVVVVVAVGVGAGGVERLVVSSTRGAAMVDVEAWFSTSPIQ